VAALAVTAAACVILQRAFPSGSWYPYHLSDLLVVAAFSAAGLYLTASSPRARGLQMVFVAYLLLNVATFAVHGPVGSNSTRLFTIAGVPAPVAGGEHQPPAVVAHPDPPARAGARAPARPGRAHGLLGVD